MDQFLQKNTISHEQDFCGILDRGLHGDLIANDVLFWNLFCHYFMQIFYCQSPRLHTYYFRIDTSSSNIFVQQAGNLC